MDLAAFDSQPQGLAFAKQVFLTGELVDAGVNIHAVSVPDTGVFGTVRLVTDKVTEARDALERAGSSWADVVRTRLILTDIDDWKAVVEVRKRFCRAAKPVDKFDVEQPGRIAVVVTRGSARRYRLQCRRGKSQ